MDANTQTYTIPAVIFAGGKSSRMGQDKALLPFGSHATLCHYQYQRLSLLFPKVYISAKADKCGAEAPTITDRYPQSSPMVGLVSVLESIPYDTCFILSVDAPFVDERVIGKLLWASQDLAFDAIVAESPKGRQPLCGIYRRSILPLAKQFITEDRHSLTRLLDQAHSCFVGFENEAYFENLNHPHEYEAAYKRMKTGAFSSE